MIELARFQFTAYNQFSVYEFASSARNRFFLPPPSFTNEIIDYLAAHQLVLD
jgi:hypothetical protein